MRIVEIVGLGAMAALALAGCAKEERLPGTRYDVTVPLNETLSQRDIEIGAAGAAAVVPLPSYAPPPNRSLAASIPAGRILANWPQRAVTPTHHIPALAQAGALQQLFAVNIGAGNAKRRQVSTSPVSDGARIFTIDAASRVTAVTPSGAVAWTASLIPPASRGAAASGGGLAVSGGVLYATTGYGQMVAMDAGTGGVLWTQDLGAVGGAAPAVVGGTIYVTTYDNRGFAIRASDGKVLWTVSGLPAPVGYAANAGPVVDDRIVIFPFSGGEMKAVLRGTGLPSWTASVVGKRTGRAWAGNIDIVGDPALVGSTLYAGNASGLLQAIDAGRGEVLWTARDGTVNPLALAGGSIWLVSDNAELVRLDASTGERIWGVPLPEYTTAKIKKRGAIAPSYGPLMVGGRLLVASADGLIRLFDPASGALVGQVPLPGGAASQPIMVGGTLYVVTRDGKLAAFR